MKIKYDEEIGFENVNSIEILNKQHYFIIEQENQNLIISLYKSPKYIYKYCKNKKKIYSNIFCAVIDYKEKVDIYEVIIRLYNIYKIGNNDSRYINYLLKLKRIFNTKRLNIKNILKEMIYIQINSIFIKNTKLNFLKDNLKEMIIIYEFGNKKINNNIRIFGNKFVKNNKNKLILIINGIKKELTESLKIRDIYNKNKIKIKIIQLKEIIDLSEMFAECNIITKI